ncbi:tyrosine-type recombinase/integrase [Aquisphaera insulae]|uniref:tyrosine-type recombinase/integrase n=1 Tax=Aquisphaera insulae TaxID=2712864 RepID=UPI0013EDBB56|nr:tyrosine-type recombinase/integrase [Aquisphaera insulae]
MASLEQRPGGRWRIVFVWEGRRHSHSLAKATKEEATACRHRLEESLRLVDRGILQIPPGADVGRFLVSGGKVTAKPGGEAPLTLSALLKRYEAEHPAGRKEANTRDTERIHAAHLTRLLGKSLPVASISTEALQRYVDRRGLEKGRRGRTISHATVRKELGTLASIWNRWAKPLGLVPGPLSLAGLTFGKVRGKPPFQVREQIERQIARGGLTDAQIDELWGSLFLTLDQVRELLDAARERCHARWAFVAISLAAYTGARRSEILRSRVDDLDFDRGVVTLREKKKDRGSELTFRTVPMAGELRAILREWLDSQHPGGPYTVCGKGGRPISVQMAAKAFRQALKGSPWAVAPGYHTLRHSFASNCALKGIDERVVDSWMGHQTEAMRRRYRHLFPDQQQDAIRSVFGD